MSQLRRTLERLIQQGTLPINHAETAATHLEVYPKRRTWLVFFDNALLIIGAVAVVLSLVFFIAYNWQNMGKMGKFALVEGLLVVTIALYVALSFRRRFQLVHQLLLLIASVITGSLLALFGQVYQTGADTWQLFFGWAILIMPWVIIARFPALWLLWLGLIHACLILYLDITNLQFISQNLQSVFQMVTVALFNFITFYLWLISFESTKAYSNSPLIHRMTPKTLISDYDDIQHNPPYPATTSRLHWGTYVIGLLSAFFMTCLAIITIFDTGNIWGTLISIMVWCGWCGFMFWQFYQRRADVLMLTYLSCSIITAVMFWMGRFLLDDFNAGSSLILALLLIGMSSSAIVWLRNIANVNSVNIESEFAERGSDE